MRNGVAVVFAALIVLSAVGPAVATGQQPAAVDTDRDITPQRDDPDEDVIGWEGGYWHDESIDVDQSDGLTDAEVDAYVARAMARVEYLRQEEFQSEVPVEVLSRSEFQQRSANNTTSNASYDAWNNQVWEALFIVGEQSGANSELQGATGQTTAGFYAPSDDRIRIITDSPDSPTIDNATLVHELVHALQDQTGDLGERISGAQTQDADLAVDGVVEGEANYIEQQYTDRCGAEWECVSTPSDGDGGTGAPPNLGILLTLLHPYSDGPVYVHDLYQQGGWDAVDAAFDDPPKSTEQIIHQTEEEPTPIEYRDRARNGWETFPNQGENGSDTVGEASMYVMFWYQARTARADTVPVQSVARTTSEYDMYNYDAEPSAGWGNDRVFPYQRTAEGETEYGYVWVTEWDSERDAAEFTEAYRAILDAQGATQQNGTHVIPSGEFEDAFRIDRDGTRVTIVNGPTTEALSQIRPADATGGDPVDGGEFGEGVEGNESAETTDDSTGLEAPGFGALTAVLAVFGAVALLARRRA